MKPETLARLFHETYERLAPSHGYETRTESAVPWERVPANNKALMVDVARTVLLVLNDGVPTVDDELRVWEVQFSHMKRREDGVARQWRTNGVVLVLRSTLPEAVAAVEAQDYEALDIHQVINRSRTGMEVIL